MSSKLGYTRVKRFDPDFKICLYSWNPIGRTCPYKQAVTVLVFNNLRHHFIYTFIMAGHECYKPAHVILNYNSS